MRDMVINHEIKAMMAEYGISVTELAEMSGYGRAHTSVLLNSKLGEKQEARLLEAITKIITEG